MWKLATALSVMLLLSNPALADEQDNRTLPPTEPIGSAKMLPDGTIVMWLVVNQDGLIGHYEREYKPDDPMYREVLVHLGGLTPGEQKLVRPWP